MSVSKAEIKSRDMERLYEYISFLRLKPKLTYLFIALTDCFNLPRCNLQSYSSYHPQYYCSVLDYILF